VAAAVTLLYALADCRIGCLDLIAILVTRKHDAHIFAEEAIVGCNTCGGRG
jgi:hypothetical protein